MKWYNRIWMRGIEEIVKHPLGAVALAGGLGWSVTRALTWELLKFTSIQSATFGWKLTSGSAQIIGRHTARAAAPTVASFWARTRIIAASPITWGAVIAVGSLLTDVNLQVKHGAAPWGTGVGVAPSLHLEGGKPWWE